MKKWKLYLFGLILCAAFAGCETEKDNNAGNESKQEQQMTEAEREQKKRDIIEDILYGKKEEVKLPERPNLVQARFMNELTLRYSEGTHSVEPRVSYVDKSAGNMWTRFTASDFSQIVSFYDVEENEENLEYAFMAMVGGYEGGHPQDYPVQGADESDDAFYYRRRAYNREKLVEALKKTNVLIIEDYPYCEEYELSEEQSKNAEWYESMQGCCYNASCAVVASIEELKELCECGQAINGLYIHFVSAPRPDLADIMIENGYSFGEYFWTDYNSGKFDDILGEDRYPTLTVNVE